jgi:hypothetical protein
MCWENWDGDAPQAEAVSMIGKCRQDGGSAAHTKHLHCISVAANFEIQQARHARVFLTVSCALDLREIMGLFVSIMGCAR